MSKYNIAIIPGDGVGHEIVPARIAVLDAVAGKFGFPYYIHINDNNAKWDWDYMVASHNFIEYVEFVYYL